MYPTNSRIPMIPPPWGRSGDWLPLCQFLLSELFPFLCALSLDFNRRSCHLHIWGRRPRSPRHGPAIMSLASFRSPQCRYRRRILCCCSDFPSGSTPAWVSIKFKFPLSLRTALPPKGERTCKTKSDGASRCFSSYRHDSVPSWSCPMSIRLVVIEVTYSTWPKSRSKQSSPYLLKSPYTKPQSFAPCPPA